MRFRPYYQAVIKPSVQAQAEGLGSEKITLGLQLENPANNHFVILSAAKHLVFTCIHEVLRSSRSLMRTGERTFAAVAPWFEPLPQSTSKNPVDRRITAVIFCAPTGDRRVGR